MTKEWQVYLLYNTDHKRTYIGATTDVKRRLRQHRQEIVGGAKSTTKLGKNWNLVCFLGGFATQSEAYRWEKILKSRCRGYKPRVFGFANVGEGKCPINPKRPKLPAYPVPKKIVLYFFAPSTDNINSSSVSGLVPSQRNGSENSPKSEVLGVSI